METKERLIRELAGCLAQLFDHEFQSIGGIYFVSSVEWTRNRSVIASIDGDDSIPRFSPDPLHHPRSCFRSFRSSHLSLPTRHTPMTAKRFGLPGIGWKTG